MQQKIQEAAKKAFKPHFFLAADLQQSIFEAGAEWRSGPDAWIRVEDGKPIPTFEQQTFWTCNAYSKLSWEGFYREYDQKWFNISGEEIFVTHWQPMPQLPNV